MEYEAGQQERAPQQQHDGAVSRKNASEVDNAALVSYAGASQPEEDDATQLFSGCQGDCQACDYDNVTYAVSGAPMMEILTSKYESPSECISIWIKELETNGFRSFQYGYDEFDEDDNAGAKKNDQDGFIIEDPFTEIDPKDVVKYEREDGLDANAGLKGHCSAFLQSGFELNGKWRNGKREGPGLICGPALEKRGIQIIWGKYKAGYLTGPAKVTLLNGNCTLEGNFIDGKLHGPVLGLSSRGRLAWAGIFKHGRPYGSHWRGLEGGVFQYGHVGPKGLFSGRKNAFLYPDLKTALYGKFKNGRMTETVPVNVKEVFLEKTGTILRIKFSKPDFCAPTYKFWPSSLNVVAVPPLLEDPYEQKYVYAGKSSMSDHAGDGLFLKRDVPANTTIAFYNGIRVRPGEPAPYVSTGYQIFVDENKKPHVTSDYMDIPPEYISLHSYKASLAHKINHSFDPNCRWGSINHPTFGRVPRVVTLKNLSAGTELSCHYMIDMEEAADDLATCKWYVDLWDEFSRGKRQEAENMDTMSDDESTNSS